MIIVMKQQVHESTEIVKVLLSSMDDARQMVEENLEVIVGTDEYKKPDKIYLLQIDAQGDPTDEGDSFDIKTTNWWSQVQKAEWDQYNMAGSGNT